MSPGAIPRLGGMRWPKMMCSFPSAPMIDLAPFLPIAAPIENDDWAGRTDAAYAPNLNPARGRRLTDTAETSIVGSADLDGIVFPSAKDTATFEADWLASRIKL